MHYNSYFLQFWRLKDQNIAMSDSGECFILGYIFLRFFFFPLYSYIAARLYVFISYNPRLIFKALIPNTVSTSGVKFLAHEFWREWTTGSGSQSCFCC